MSEHEHEQEPTRPAEPDRVSPDVEAAIDARRGTGRPLDADLRSHFGARLGDPLDDVRIHTDATAGTLSRAVDARAFAIGRDVFFGEGEYRPQTTAGERLLAHELSHVAQQRGASASGPLELTQPGDAVEREADAMADAALAGGTPTTAGQAAPAVARLGIADAVRKATEKIGTVDETAQREPREQTVTAADARRLNAIAQAPLLQCGAELGAGESSVPKAKAVLAKLKPIAEGIVIVANDKKKAENRDVYYDAVNSVSDAEITLQVMTADEGATPWAEPFQQAMGNLDTVIALPVQTDDDTAPPDTSSISAPVSKIDHELLVSSVKPQLAALIARTQGKIHEDWDPKEVAADTTAASSLDAVAHRGMILPRTSLRRAMAGVKAAGMSMDEQRAEAVGKVMVAHAKVSALAARAAPQDAPPPPTPSTTSAPPASSGQPETGGTPSASTAPTAPAQSGPAGGGT